jgi:hypothetical protein
MPAMGHKGGASLRGAIAHTERHPTGRQQRYELLAHGWGQRPGALAHLHAQEERALGSARRPDPAGRPREPLARLGFPAVPAAPRTAHGGECIELDRMAVQRGQKIGGKGFERLGGLPHPAEPRMGIDRDAPGGAPATQPFGQTRDATPEARRRGALAMQDRAGRLSKSALAEDPLQLAPGRTAGMTRGADVATAEPTRGGASWSGAAVRVGVDRAPTSAGAADAGRWEARRLGARVGPLFTGLTERCRDAARQRVGGWGTRASGRGRRAERLGYGPGSVGPPTVPQEADQHESHQEQLGQQPGRRHTAVLLHGDESRPFSRSHPLPHYPLSTGTGPGRSCWR